MKTYFFPHALVTLMMVFLIMSCATDPNIESARLALSQADFEEVIRSAEAAIESNPESGDGYFYKGIAHAYMAQDKAPDDRLDDYRSARTAFDEAKLRYEAQEVTSTESEEIPQIIIELWGYEHNSGFDPLTDDIVSSHQDSLQLAQHHFLNATTINPDSVQSFNVLAEVYFALGESDEAERITRHIIYDMGRGDLFNYYRLSYHLMDSDRDAEALEVLFEARERFPEEIEIVQEIANVYLRMGETDQALETVSLLMESDPNNPQYRLVYATQIYQMVQDLDTQIRDLHDEIYDLSRELRDKSRNPGANQAEIEQLRTEIDRKQAEVDDIIAESFRFSEEAEEQLLVALENDSENPDVHSTLGIVYQNRAAVLQDQRNMSEDMDEADEYDRQAREYLRKSLPYYEKAAELEPQNIEHWRSLFRVYTNLGMDEEAQRAQEAAGI